MPLCSLAGCPSASSATSGGWHGAFQPGLEGLHPREGFADQAVDRRVEHAARVKLVANADLAARRQDRPALVVELVLGFQAAKIGPGAVEAAGHADHFFAVGARHARGDRVMQVAPGVAGGGQAFDLEMGHVRDHLAHLRGGGAIVVDRGARGFLPANACNALEKGQVLLRARSARQPPHRPGRPPLCASAPCPRGNNWAPGSRYRTSSRRSPCRTWRSALRPAPRNNRCIPGRQVHRRPAPGAGQHRAHIHRAVLAHAHPFRVAMPARSSHFTET